MCKGSEVMVEGRLISGSYEVKKEKNDTSPKLFAINSYVIKSLIRWKNKAIENPDDIRQVFLQF